MEDSVGKKSNKYYKRLDTLLFFSMLYVLLLTIFEEFHYQSLFVNDWNLQIPMFSFLDVNIFRNLVQISLKSKSIMVAD